MLAIMSKIPGPRNDTHPLLGHIPKMVGEFASGRMNNEWKLDMNKTFGTTVAQFIGPVWSRVVNVGLSNPRDVKYILETNFKNYVKPDNMRNVLGDFLGEGIFAANHANVADGGAHWRLQRKTASNIFTQRNFRGDFFDTFVLHGKKVVRIIDEATRTNKPFDIQKLMFNFTLDSIGHIGFGVNLGCLDGNPAKFAKCFDRAQHLSFMRFVDPLWPTKRAFAKYFGVKNSQSELFDCLKVLSDFSQDVVSERLNDPDLEKRGDILSRFMNKKNPETGEHFNFDFLRDIVMSFFIAGRDTTACTLTFAIKLLAEHPSAQERLFREVIVAFGSDGDPECDSVGNLPYLDAVIKESLRLYPPVPSDVKGCVDDDTLPSGHFLPAGTDVTFEPYAMGRSTELWGEDAHLFNPERWLGEKIGPPEDMFKFPVFQAGPRYCLGMRMALLEAKVLTAMIVRKYVFELVPGQNFQFSTMITLSLLNGLQCTATARQHHGDRSRMGSTMVF